MTQLQALNPQDHGHLRLRARSAATPHFVQIVTSEFAAAAARCPILFSKDAASGSFYAGAMFGFKPGECLLDDGPGFSPLSLQRDGFFISGEHIVIDRDHPRFSERDGEPLFDASRQPSVCLREMQRTLGQLHAGLEATNAFIDALSGLKLIEPIDVSLSFDSGERVTLQGLYTVSLDALREIDDAAVVRLFRSGYLQLAYIMNASLKQISVLAQLRNASLNPGSTADCASLPAPGEKHSAATAGIFGSGKP